MVRQVRDLQKALFRGVFYCLIALLLPVSIIVVGANEVLSPAEKEIVVVAPDRPLRDDFLVSLGRVLPVAYQIKVVPPEEFASTELNKAGYIIALGSASLQVVRDRKVNLPVIVSYISSLSFEEIGVNKPMEAALFPVTNWRAQMLLAKQLLPNAQSIGVLVSSESQKIIPEMEKQAKSLGYNLVFSQWDGHHNLPRILNKLLLKVDYILAIEDPLIFNRDTIKSILLTSYRKNKVVIGPNASYVVAGSLATTWCTTDDVVEAIIRMIDSYQLTGSLPGNRKLSCLSVAINEQVAKSLSIDVPEKLRDGKMVMNEEVKD